MAAETRRDWKRKESLPAALAQIGVVALVLAGAVYFIKQRGEKREETAKHMKEARNFAQRDNPADLNKALAELDELFKTDRAPDGLALAADLHTELWLVHKVPGADAKAKDFLRQAEEADSKSEDRFATHALHLVADGKYSDADAYVEDLRKKGANTAKLWYAQGRAQEGLGNIFLAKEGYRQAMDKAWKNPQYASTYGELMLSEGNFLQALDILSKGTSANPEHLRARLDVALARIYKKDKVKDATDAIAEILANPDLTPALKARALAGQAELATFDGKFDDAVKLADQALAENPEEHFALLAKAHALGGKKDPAAVDAYKAAVAKRKYAPVTYFDGAVALQEAGNTQAAMDLLDQYQKTFADIKITTGDGKTVAALDRDDRYWLTRGDVLKASGKLDDAMASYDKAIAAENVNLVKAHYAKGSIFLAKKDYDKAIETLTSITPPDGTGALGEAYQAMGDALFAKKDFATGCQHFAFALTRFRAQQAPRERLNGILEDVNKRLIAGGQAPMAKLWMQEAKPLIQ